MILLDTHALIWLDQASDRLGRQARDIIDAATRAGELAVSAISFWETAMLLQRGRITLSLPLEVWRADLLGAGLVEIAVTGMVGIRAALLRDVHPDPADRLIVASALEQRAALVTADTRILEWPGQLQRVDARF